MFALAGLAVAVRAETESVKPYTLEKCFISGHEFGDEMVEFDFQGRHIKLCCKDCEKEFRKDPDKFMSKLEAAENKPIQDIGVERFEALRKDKKNVVLDVRTWGEYQAGHMPGAVWMDVNSSDFTDKAKKLDPNKTYLVHCAAGERSAKACKKLDQLHFKRLYNLEGGMRAWMKAGNQPEK